ncbi:RNA methyltransferase [Thiohalomonas denitrificans]|uniref:tRNA (cytidine/uridine-2'-O-)-methyltransferase TrmJ n=1 Tax=Thiohalomonas denitrificans TaxID=415747 RepID=A0A1G5Q1Y7_9GAMM|nr:RNA methyltransferase [Thiohalomonas denitrificans]SCZ55421.1 tRNA (cytidine32/uridine32-2'-O)-methyltransferase [Thiohalomonas denitrificans]
MKFPKLRIVMVGTSHPGNIGAAARAMKNMGIGRLYLVEPREFPSPEASARASGADDILATATVCDTLDEALTGCSLVFGASARLRTIPWPLLNARQCGEEAVAHPGEVAIVFGREHSGLSNEELERCNYLVHIPTDEAFSSLNVAAAIQVVSYEVMMASGSAPVEATQRDEPASAEDVERLYAHLEETLVELDFLDPDHPRKLMRRLRRLFNRSALEATEVNILRGILTAAQKAARSD